MQTEPTIQPTAPADDPSGGKPRKRNAAIGVTAGLLAGGAIGLVMTVPSLTSAATDDTGVTDAAITAQVDDTDATTDAPLDGRPEPGIRLRELLQPLVEDGTLSEDQADAVATYLAEQRPEREGPGHGRHHRGPAFDGEVVAGLIGIDAETLRAELAAGNSIADIAEANGVDPDTIVDALVDELAGHLDLMVEDGRLTDDEAAERLEQAAERIADRVERTPPMRG